MSIVQAQQTTTGPETPLTSYGVASPEAASLTRFGTIPVSPYTGATEVSISLAKVEGVTMNVPIRLRYHASGIKVRQDPPAIGTGWTLQVGGVLTQMTRGLPDSIGLQTTDGREMEEVLDGQATETEEKDYFEKVVNNQQDSHPDLYTYNVRGQSGTFFQTLEGNFYTAPHSKLDFTPSSSDGTWTVDTPDGRTYVMGGSSVTAGSPDLSGVVSGGSRSWYLSKMVSANGASEIFFDYRVLDLKTVNIYDTQTIEHKYNDGSSESMTFLDCPSSSASGSSKSVTKSTRSVLPTRIDTDRQGAEIDYQCNAENTDCRVKQITLRSSSGDLLRQVHFFHSSFANGKRRLDSLRIEGRGTSDAGTYRFSYFDDGGTKELPGRASHSIDHWGYANGPHDESAGLVPGYEIKGERYPGADRSTNETWAMVGTLSKVEYPTGGEARFTYGAHEYEDTKQVARSRSTTSSTEVSDDPPTTTTYSEYFDLENRQDLDIETQYRSFCQYSSSTMENEVTYNYGSAEVWLEDGSGNRVWSDARVSKKSDGTQVTGDRTGTVTKSIDRLEAGTYRLGAETDLSNGTDGTYGTCTDTSDNVVVSIDASWQTTEIVTRQAGGVRIEKVVRDANDGSPPVTRTFRYTSADDPSLTSGEIANEPLYGYQYENRVENPECEGGTATCYTRVMKSSSIVGTATTGGSAVGYERVVEEQSDGGTIVRTYTVPQGPAQFGLGKYSLINGYDAGQLLTKTVRSADGSVEKEVTNTYAFDATWENEHTGASITEVQQRGTSVTKDLDYTEYRSGNSICGIYEQGKGYLNRTYRLQSRWYHPASKTVRWVDGGTSTSRTTDYTFEPRHLQVQEKTVRGSTGKTRTVRYRYAHEEYPDMGLQGTRRLDAKYRTSILNGDGTVVKRSWQTWTKTDVDGDAVGEWVPYEEWEWKK